LTQIHTGCRVMPKSESADASNRSQRSEFALDDLSHRATGGNPFGLRKMRRAIKAEIGPGATGSITPGVVTISGSAVLPMTCRAGTFKRSSN
jgi:hypothetical protein